MEENYSIVYTSGHKKELLTKFNNKNIRILINFDSIYHKRLSKAKFVLNDIFELIDLDENKVIDLPPYEIFGYDSFHNELGKLRRYKSITLEGVIHIMNELNYINLIEFFELMKHINEDFGIDWFYEMTYNPYFNKKLQEAN